VNGRGPENEMNSEFSRYCDVEKSRTAKLSTLLATTGPHPSFQALCAQLTASLNVPIALVGLASGTVMHYKGNCGFPIDCTARKFSFGAFLMNRTKLDCMTVEDAREDIRFSLNPLVVGPPHVVSYAGHVIRTAQGLRVGAVSVFDHQPRVFNEIQLALLKKTANFVNMIVDAIPDPQQEVYSTKTTPPELIPKRTSIREPRQLSQYGDVKLTNGRSPPLVDSPSQRLRRFSSCSSPSASPNSGAKRLRAEHSGCSESSTDSCSNSSILIPPIIETGIPPVIETGILSDVDTFVLASIHGLLLEKAKIDN
jgi:hypothetical protein